MASLNKELLATLYLSGKSIPEIARLVQSSVSGVRYHLKKAGILRNRSEAVKMSGYKISLANKGKKRPIKDETKQKLRDIAIQRGEKNARGFSLNSQGYYRSTRGTDKEKHLHRLIAEKVLQRKLSGDEVVHHLDGNKTNNSNNNLVIMERLEHNRMHALTNYQNRRRDNHGRFV